LHIISNSGEGLRFTELVRSYQPYNILSEIRLRDGDGRYSAEVTSAAAKALGVRRRRFQIPASAFGRRAVWDAERRLEDAFASARSVEVTLPDLVQAEPGDAVVIAESGYEGLSLTVRDVRVSVSEDGYTTYLLLE
jgi:hypothetical protein